MSEPLPSRDPDLTDAEVDAQHAAIQKDAQSGGREYARHFDDLLDSLHASPSRSHNLEEQEDDSVTKEKKERAFQELARALKSRCNQQLETHGLIVKRVRRNIGGRGFLVDAIDRVRRQYDCAVDFDTMGVQMALSPHEAFRVAANMVVESLLKAKADYARRAGLA